METEQISEDGGAYHPSPLPSSHVAHDSDNNNNQQQQFSEEEKNLLVHKYLMIQDFPSCKDEISAHFSCLRRVKFLLPSLQRFPEPLSTKEICGKTDAKMTFCILSSFCPGEAKRLTNCMGGKIPNVAGHIESSFLPFV